MLNTPKWYASYCLPSPKAKGEKVKLKRLSNIDIEEFKAYIKKLKRSDKE